MTTAESGTFSCPVCGDEGRGDDRADCPTCATPHHRDCWDYTGGCAIFGCEATRALVVGTPDDADEVAARYRAGLCALDAGDRPVPRRPLLPRAGALRTAAMMAVAFAVFARAGPALPALTAGLAAFLGAFYLLYRPGPAPRVYLDHGGARVLRASRLPFLTGRTVAAFSEIDAVTIWSRPRAPAAAPGDAGGDAAGRAAHGAGRAADGAAPSNREHIVVLGLRGREWRSCEPAFSDRDLARRHGLAIARALGSPFRPEPEAGEVAEPVEAVPVPIEGRWRRRHLSHPVVSVPAAAPWRPAVHAASLAASLALIAVFWLRVLPHIPAAPPGAPQLAVLGLLAFGLLYPLMTTPYYWVEFDNRARLIRVWSSGSREPVATHRFGEVTGVHAWSHHGFEIELEDGQAVRIAVPTPDGRERERRRGLLAGHLGLTEALPARAGPEA